MSSFNKLSAIQESHSQEKDNEELRMTTIVDRDH